MRRTKFRLLLLTTVLLTACGGEDGPVEPPGGNGGCVGAPVPETVSLWTECLSPSVGPSLECLDAGVQVILTNSSPEPVYVNYSCGLRGNRIAAVAAGGALIDEPACLVGDCVAPVAPWLVLPAGGGTLEFRSLPHTYGPHVATLRVGLRCTPYDPFLGPQNFITCAETLDLTTPVFDVVP